MLGRVLGTCLIATCMCGLFTGWAGGAEEDPAPDIGAVSGTLRPGRNLDMEQILAEPLSETLKGIHEFWWGPLESPPWDPEQYVSWVLDLSRMKKLMLIARDGSEAEKTELLRAANDWLDRYLLAYPAVNYVGNTEGHAGFSLLHPGMDAALALVVAELDPSRESLERITAAFDLHTDALHYSHERNNVQKRPDDDGVVRSQTTHVFGIAAIRLVENAQERGLAWLIDDDETLQKYEVALEVAKRNHRMLHDYVAVIDVARSGINASEE